MRVCQDEARGRGHASISSDTLLFAVLSQASQETEGIVGQIIGERPDLAARIRELNSLDSVGASSRKLTLSPQGKQAIDQAFELARQLRREYIGLEHLLYGCLSVPSAGAKLVLAEVGPLEQIRQKIAELHTLGFPRTID